jgi:hypothetical protein
VSAAVRAAGHQPVRSILAAHAADWFQSPTTSWSSKIIELGTVDSSQRTSGCDHASTYAAAYSAKLTGCPGGASSSGRAA